MVTKCTYLLLLRAGDAVRAVMNGLPSSGVVILPRLFQGFEMRDIVESSEGRTKFIPCDFSDGCTVNEHTAEVTKRHAEDVAQHAQYAKGMAHRNDRFARMCFG